MHSNSYLMLTALMNMTYSDPTPSVTCYLQVVNSTALEILRLPNGLCLPLFEHEEINELIRGNSFTFFKRAFPKTKCAISRQVYSFETDNIDFIAKLKRGFPEIFPHYFFITVGADGSYTLRRDTDDLATMQEIVSASWSNKFFNFKSNGFI